MHVFAQIFEGKLRIHIIHGYNHQYHEYDNGYNKPMYMRTKAWVRVTQGSALYTATPGNTILIHTHH